MLVPLTVGEIMVTDVETVAEDATAREVAERLTEANVGSLVVVEGEGPAGIVTESDLTRLLATETDVDGTTVREFASTGLVTVEPGTRIERAAELLAEHDIRRLPVVKDGDLEGIVTATDLSHYLPRLTGHATRGQSDRQQHYRVRPETAYEEPGWEFESRSVEERAVSVGDTVEFSKTIDDDDVRDFARASGDTNRLHLEEEYAAETRFGQRIVHGTLVGGLISAALARLPGLTIYLSQELSFLAAVGVGDRVTAVCEVVEALGNDRYLLTTDVYDEDQEEKIIEGEAVVIIDDLPELAHVEVEELPET